MSEKKQREERGNAHSVRTSPTVVTDNMLACLAVKQRINSDGNYYPGARTTSSFSILHRSLSNIHPELYSYPTAKVTLEMLQDYFIALPGAHSTNHDTGHANTEEFGIFAEASLSYA